MFMKPPDYKQIRKVLNKNKKNLAKMIRILD